MTSNVATAGDLLKACGNRRYATISVAGMDVRIRSITAREYAEVEALLTRSAVAARGNQNAKQVKALCDANALLIQLHVCDEDGNLVFTKDNLQQLCEMDNAVTQTIADACIKHSGIDAADLETIAKNSATASPSS